MRKKLQANFTNDTMVQITQRFSLLQSFAKSKNKDVDSGEGHKRKMVIFVNPENSTVRAICSSAHTVA